MTLRTLSLGWGVQSWTLAAMAAVGEVEPFDFAIHSDTTFERQETYRFTEQWTQWLQDRGLPVITVSDPRATHIMKKSSTSEGTYTLMPIFTLAQDGSKGQLRRQCTSRWKIEPLHKWLSGELARRSITKSNGAIVQALGISMDEWQRMKSSPVDWIENTYPLVDMRMSRDDCLRWLGAHGLPSPGKSACVQCPYHSPRVWRDMKRANDDDWTAAVAADELLRATGNQWYLHPARIPLIDAARTPEDDGQMSLWDDEVDPTCDSGHCFL